MVKITCRAIDCIFWDDNLCSSDEIIYDPEEGCLTYELIDDILDDDDWEDDDELDDLVDDDQDLDFPYDDDEADDDDDNEW
ncbi:MAG: hypothetical protein ACE5G8_09725 [Anaerolineae bacterium]